MSAKTRLLRHLEPLIPADEPVELVIGAQLRKGAKRLLATSVATGVATGLVTTALTGGIGVYALFLPPPVWVVVTSRRVLVFRRLSNTSRPGDLLFDAPRELLGVQRRFRGLLQVIIIDREDGRSLVKLNFGWRPGAAKRFVAAVPVQG